MTVSLYFPSLQRDVLVCGCGWTTAIVLWTNIDLNREISTTNKCKHIQFNKHFIASSYQKPCLALEMQKKIPFS